MIPKVIEGYARHQYILVVDRKSWDSYSSLTKTEILDRSLGTDLYSVILTETIRYDDEFVAFRYWMDLPENEFPYSGITPEEYKLYVDKINNPEKYSKDNNN